MFPAELYRVGGAPRQQGKEFLEAFFVPAEIRRKLPENGPELFSQREHAGSKEVSQRCFNIAQLFHVRDETRAFDAEEKIPRSRFVPAAVTGRKLEGIERAVDLDGIERRGGELELARLRQIFGVKLSPPSGVTPSRDADA